MYKNFIELLEMTYKNKNGLGIVILYLRNVSVLSYLSSAITRGLKRFVI